MCMVSVAPTYIRMVSGTPAYIRILSGAYIRMVSGAPAYGHLSPRAFSREGSRRGQKKASPPHPYMADDIPPLGEIRNENSKKRLNCFCLFIWFLLQDQSVRYLGGREGGTCWDNLWRGVFVPTRIPQLCPRSSPATRIPGGRSSTLPHYVKSYNILAMSQGWFKSNVVTHCDIG